jgi:hypothetical protein
VDLDIDLTLAERMADLFSGTVESMAERVVAT